MSLFRLRLLLRATTHAQSYKYLILNDFSNTRARDNTARALNGVFMIDAPKVNTDDGMTSAYAAAVALQPSIDAIKRGTPGPVQRLIEIAIPLRPVTWWNEVYIEELKLLCESIYLASHYNRLEIKAALDHDLKLAEKYHRMANAKVPVIRALQTTLQLTPSQLHGQANRFNGSAKAHQQIHDMLTDVTDLYAN